MKIKLIVFGIAFVLLMVGLSGCSDYDFSLFDGDDGDMYGEDKECAVYCYITVIDRGYENNPEFYENVPELLLSANIECDNQVIKKFLSAGNNYRIENGYVGLVYMNQSTNFSDAILQVYYYNMVNKEYVLFDTRTLSYDVASNGGTNDRYNWVEKFILS